MRAIFFFALLRGLASSSSATAASRAFGDFLASGASRASAAYAGRRLGAAACSVIEDVSVTAATTLHRLINDAVLIPGRLIGGLPLATRLRHAMARSARLWVEKPPKAIGVRCASLPE